MLNSFIKSDFILMRLQFNLSLGTTYYRSHNCSAKCRAICGQIIATISSFVTTLCIPCNGLIINFPSKFQLNDEISLSGQRRIHEGVSNLEGQQRTKVN